MPARRSGHPFVVLVVDDHEDTREMYVQFLEAVGHTARAATTCADALSQVREGDIDAVLLDRRLPDGDGAEVCRTLKADAKTRAMPVIVLSGRKEDDPIGADAYLMKPVVPDEVVGVLTRLLESKDGGAAPR
jgi:DNA-binding response OmpR family regulator